MSFLKIFLARLIVENPDFETSNPLFALTNIYILNLISKKLSISYGRVRELLGESSSKYYYECITKIYIISEHKSYKESLRHLRFFYKMEKQENFSPDKNGIDITGWGTIYSLTRTSSLKYMGNEINLPEKLFLPQKLIDIHI
jgi:hypothetical protein